MSIEALEQLVKKAESMDNDQAEQTKKTDPDYQSADDIKKLCRERATKLIGKYHIAAAMIKPEAAALVLTDPEIEKGIDKLAAVLEKYPVNKELPPWIKKLLGYEEVFLCGAWFAGSLYSMNEVDKMIQAEKEKEDNKDGD